MAIANPRIHMICGICGDNKSLTFRVSEEEQYNDDDQLYTKQEVYISCRNCGSLTGLDEVIEEQNK